MTFCWIKSRRAFGCVEMSNNFLSDTLAVDAEVVDAADDAIKLSTAGAWREFTEARTTSASATADRVVAVARHAEVP